MSTGNGKRWEAEEVQFRLAVVAGGDTYIWGAVGHSESVFNTFVLSSGISVAAYSNSLTPTYTVDVEIDGTPVASASDGAYHADTEVVITLSDVKVYCLLSGGLWRLDYSGAEIDIDGSVTSVGGGSLTSTGVGPGYLPLWGIPWTIGGPTDFALDGTGSGNVLISGGWRFKQDGVWFTPPCVLPPFDASSAAERPPASILSISNTWDAQIAAELIVYGSGHVPPSEGTEEDMYLTCLPNLEKGYQKLGVDPSDLWYRAAMPQVTASDSLQVRSQFSEVTTGGTEVIYAEEAELLQHVTASTSDVEDIFEPPTYCPCACGSGDKLYVVPFPEYPIGETMAFAFPTSVSVGGGAWSSPFAHVNALASYVSSWPAPHWHILSWGEDWELEGSNTDPNDYWYPIREKWIRNNPASIDLEARTSLVSFEPLPFESGLQPWWDTYQGGLAWVGAHAFDAKAVTVLTTYTYTSASSSLWSAVTGSIGHGGSVSLTPSGGLAEFELDLGSWTVEPYMWPHVATHVNLDWPLTNVTAARVYVVGVDGEEQLLELNPGDGFTTAGERYRLPQFGADKFAGSWVVDNGFGVVTESAADVGADGISSTVYGDEEGSGASELGPTGVAAKLRFEFDLTGAASMDYPEIEYSPEGNPAVQVENSNVQALLWANGPGVRFGFGSYYVAGLQNPPVLKGLGKRNTAVDALCWSRQWLEARAYNDALTTEISSLYDSVEIQTTSVADEGTNACILPTSASVGATSATSSASTIYFALVRNQRELPPMATLPLRKFDGSWERTGDHAQVSYTFSQGRRDLIAAGSTELVLKNGSGVIKSLALAGAPVGWKVAGFSDGVLNDEDDWTIWHGGTQLAEDVRPWHGYFAAHLTGAASGMLVSIDRDLAWRHYRASGGAGGDLAYAESDNTLDWLDIAISVAGQFAAIAVAKVGKPTRRMLVSDSGAVRLWAAAPGADFTLISTEGSGEHVALITATNGLTYAYWRDGTEIKGIIRDASNNVVEAVFTAVATVDDGSEVDVTYGPTQGGTNRITLQVYVSSVLTTMTSTDGVTFV